VINASIWEQILALEFHFQTT